jgi:hypothetical protein
VASRFIPSINPMSCATRVIGTPAVMSDEAK